MKRYEILRRVSKKFKSLERHLKATLPPGLEKRVASLMAKEKAAFLWSTHQRHPVTREMRATIRYLWKYVRDTPNPWETPIPLAILRTYHFRSYGDASFVGGGAFLEILEIWFDLGWSARIIRGLMIIKPGAPGFVHINSMEFVVVIVKLAAIITWKETASPQEVARAFPHGMPHFLAWLGFTDNTTSLSWANKATSSSPQGQSLLGVWSALLERAQIMTLRNISKGSRTFVLMISHGMIFLFLFLLAWHSCL